MPKNTWWIASLLASLMLMGGAAFYAKQQQALNRQSDLVDRMFQQFNDLLGKLSQDYAEKQNALEEFHGQN